jgi:hypothetical protein
VVDEVLGDEGELGEVAEDRLRIEGGRSTQRRPHCEGVNGARLLAVGSEWRPTVRGGGPSLAVLEEVALVQPDRRRSAQERATRRGAEPQHVRWEWRAKRREKSWSVSPTRVMEG